MYSTIKIKLEKKASHLPNEIITFTSATCSLKLENGDKHINIKKYGVLEYSQEKIFIHSITLKF